MNDVKRFTNSRPLRPGSEDFAVSGIWPGLQNALNNNILSNGSRKNYRENNRPSAAGAVWVSGLIQLFLAFSLVDWSFSAKFKLKCKNAGFR